MLKGIVIFQLAIIFASENDNTTPLNHETMLIKWVIMVLCIITIFLIGYKIFIKRKRLMTPTSKWLLFIGFIILSPLVYFMNFGIAFQESKPVNFCNSCHIMNGYIDDLRNSDSESIAALHYQYRWIADDQCYGCHSDYGLFGTYEAKMAGIRHIWKYYIVGYETPIKIRGTYDNHICLHCHAPVEVYQDVEEHEDYLNDLELNKLSCFGADCHVSPHPKEAWRK